jgi:large subunit ribosomal protein L25
MERLQVKANLRQEKGKGAARKIRAKGSVPAILYGLGVDPMPLTVNLFDFDKLLEGVEGTGVLLDLSIDGKETLPVMLRDYQVDVITRKFEHLDFQKVDLTKKIKLEVPIHLVGKAPGVKDGGGILEHMRRQLEIKCLPTAIPEAIDVDVSQLNIGDILHVSDIKLPEGVEVLTALDQTVAAVMEPPPEPTVEEVAAATEAAPTEPEVIGAKKEEEGEGEEKDKEKDKKKEKASKE